MPRKRRKYWIDWELVDNEWVFFVTTTTRFRHDARRAVNGKLFDSGAEAHAYRSGLDDAQEEFLKK